MRDRIALLRDYGTEVRFAGQSRGMRDGWQVWVSLVLFTGLKHGSFTHWMRALYVYNVWE